MAKYVTSPDAITVPGPNTLVASLGAFKELADSIQQALTNLKATLGGLGAWQAFTTVWKQSNDVTLAMNSGTLTGRYVQIGKTVVGRVEMVRAANTNVGTMAYVWTLPLPQRVYQEVSGSGTITGGGGADIPVSVVGVGTGAVGLIIPSGARVGNGTKSWAGNEAIRFGFVYETN